MAEAFLGLLLLGYLVYIVVVQTPKQLKRTEEKVDSLKLHLQEVQLKLDNLTKKLEN